MEKLKTLLFLFLAVSSPGFSQDYPIQKEFYNLKNWNTNLNSSFQSEISFQAEDSINALSPEEASEAIWKRKLFHSHLFSHRSKELNINLDPFLDLSWTRGFSEKRNFFSNGRGFILSGNVSKKIFFYSTFSENQNTFPAYIAQYITTNNVIPGLGNPKIDSKGRYDFAWVSGNITYLANKNFNMQFGHGKNFIGNGYRSLLLSDYSFNYPYLKLNADIWKLNYSIMFAQFMDLRSPYSYERGYQKKWGAFHYLDIKIGSKIKLGLFESVIWQDQDSTGKRGFELNYLNPVVFYRPVEYSIGSPDNEMLGINLSVIALKSIMLYGQLALDEFYLDHIRKNDGWYANKYGVQAGFKYFNVAGIKDLLLQSEINYVRPFTYSHYTPLSNYAHYNEPLAHPFGSNFYESVSFIKYQYKSWFLNLELIYAIRGSDPDSLNMGSDIYKPYNTRANETGNYVGQGIRNVFVFSDASVSYLLNPKYNLNLFAGITWRKMSSDIQATNEKYIYAGLKTSIFNKYKDF